jgi:endonuclease YncB( thermonuclease family)
MVVLGLSQPAPAVETHKGVRAPAVQFNKYPKREDHYPGGFSWPVCAGKKEKMSECVTDGDTVRIKFKAYRLIDLDTPETKASNRCSTPEKEAAAKALGAKAKQTVVTMLSTAKDIVVTVYIDPLTKDPVTDKYGRTLSNISADGKDVASVLISSGLGHHYDGGTKTKWCD